MKEQPTKVMRWVNDPKTGRPAYVAIDLLDELKAQNAELLESFKRCVRDLEINVPRHVCVEVYKEAIAKAEGRE